jgi:hypothetical protein
VDALTTIKEVEAWVMAEVDRIFGAPCVHVLKGGYPMCGFNLKLTEWPAGHTWASFLAANIREIATCTDCLEAHASYHPS